jgi:hypothetical protein
MTNEHARFCIRRLDEQRRWFDDHGACREGYDRRYTHADGSVYGDGPDAIFEADLRALKTAEAMAIAARKHLGHRQ